jgi:VWFA-related protein
MLRVASAVLGALSVGLLSSTPVAQKPALPPRTTFVELDAVVLKAGRPVRGLHKEDFQVLEDDRSVPVVSFTEVAAAGLAGEADGRSVVLLLGNTDLRTQIVARLFVAGARPADSIAVIRMTHRDDEVTGDRREALRRIDEPQGINIVQGRSRVEDSLETIARVARDLESTEHRHKVLVCIGSRSLCDVYLAPPKTESLLWPHWTKAVDAAARANVSVYYVDPSGTATLTRPPLGDGLVEHTGGDTFFNSNNYQRIVDRVWDEAGHYYLLGYVPVDDRPCELHSIHVRMTRRGLHVRSRRSRGDQAFSTKEGTGE